MAERINNTIETQINEGNTLITQMAENGQVLQSVIQDVPQVQTVLQNGINVSSQINAPFIEVTSVNGKTGDVITEPIVGEFETNHYYLKNTMISYNDTLYYAKANFTSGNSFNANDWYAVEGTQITVDSAFSTTSENPVQNKVITSALNNKVNSSDLAEVATSGSFTDLINVPVFPTVNNATLTIQKNGTTVNTFTANSNTDKTANITVPTKTSDITNDSGFITSIPTASASTLGGIKVGDGLNITSAGLLSTKLQFVDGSTSGSSKNITLKDGDTVCYPVTSKEVVLGLKTYNASWLYDLIYDSTAFTSEQVSELREAILNKDDILIYDGDPTIPTGQTAYYRPVLASASNTLEFIGLLNISFITTGPNMYSYSFMTFDQGETWTLNANSGGSFVATKYKEGSTYTYAETSTGVNTIMLPGILTTSGTVGKFSINLGAPIIASSVTINTFKGNIRTATGGYWINTGYVNGGQDYLNTSGLTTTADINGNQVNFMLSRSSAQSGTTNNTPMTMELNALSLTFS